MVSRQRRQKVKMGLAMMGLIDEVELKSSQTYEFCVSRRLVSYLGRISTGHPAPFDQPADYWGR